MNNSSERQTENVMALDVELKTNNDSEHQTKDVALNAEMKMRL